MSIKGSDWTPIWRQLMPRIIKMAKNQADIVLTFWFPYTESGSDRAVCTVMQYLTAPELVISNVYENNNTQAKFSEEKHKFDKKIKLTLVFF